MLGPSSVTDAATPNGVEQFATDGAHSFTDGGRIAGGPLPNCGCLLVDDATSSSRTLNRELSSRYSLNITHLSVFTKCQMRRAVDYLLSSDTLGYGARR